MYKLFLFLDELLDPAVVVCQAFGGAGGDTWLGEARGT
jgi:hypothetical protein